MAINSVKMYISEKNLIYNMEYLKSNFNKEVLAVVKSNAYGHDINLITKLLYKNGYKNFAVARLVEAQKIMLNTSLSQAEILIFESIGKDFLNIIKEAIEYGILPEKIQIKIDFGFGRNGITLDYLEKLKKYIEKKNLFFNGIYSHLFAVCHRDGLKIIKKFEDVVNFLGKERFKMIHLQNSSAIEKYGSLDITTHIRVGMVIYGLQGDGFFDKNLRQVFSLRGQIAGIKNLESSNYIAYNLKSNLLINNSKYIAKVKFGYGDGFLKVNENTKCLINNKEYNITLITMDNSFIEVDENVKEGDEIIFYPDISFSVPILNMNIYELLVIITSRVEKEIVDEIK